MGEQEVWEKSKTIWKGINVVVANSRGAMSEVCILWVSSIFHLVHEDKYPYWILTSLVHLPLGKICKIVNV